MQHRAVQHSIASFLKDRQRLIVELMHLSTALERHHVEQSETALARFCQCLVDYLSNGHFRVFANGASPNSWVTPREYAILESTTAAAMTFNDEHTQAQHVARAKTKVQLAQLALALETRFEFEDEILSRTRETLALAS